LRYQRYTTTTIDFTFTVSANKQQFLFTGLVPDESYSLSYNPIVDSDDVSISLVQGGTAGELHTSTEKGVLIIEKLTVP